MPSVQDHSEIKAFLEEKYSLYNQPKFINSDPIQVPHLFSTKEDIEISAILTASIAWGRRTLIIKKAQEMMSLMENSPYDFLMNANLKDITRFEKFQYRTFKGEDAVYFIRALQNIYLNHGGLQRLFESGFSLRGNIYDSFLKFREVFFSLNPPLRTLKHIADVTKGTSAKRLNMFLRWMVREDNRGVDFGIWKNIPPSALLMPLDVHTGNVSRKLELLNRKQNDWKAVLELTENLRKYDSSDPVKYDFALFGLGVFENF
ncbi:MAG: TIGR02757 family protein [Bacteroidales bacterium]|nr:TIGR02757 family protein [Bacteroidales bacterium]